MTSPTSSSPLSLRLAALSLGGALLWLQRAKRCAEPTQGSSLATMYARLAEDEILVAVMRLPSDCRAAVAEALELGAEEPTSPASSAAEQAHVAALRYAAARLRGAPMHGAPPRHALALRLDALACVHMDSSRAADA